MLGILEKEAFLVDVDVDVTYNAVMKLLNFAGYIAIIMAFVCHSVFSGRGWEPGMTFFLAALGIIPLAHLMGESTEHLAERTGPTWGGLLNATFGNAAELIIALIAIHKGLNEMVKASLTGSIIGNLLLVFGGAMVVGGWNRKEQTFNPKAVETNGGMLAIASAAMLLPAIFHYTAISAQDRLIGEHERAISIGVSVILILIYALGLLFTLRTHATLLGSPREPGTQPGNAVKGHHWSVKKSVIVLLAASVGVAIVAELLVGSAETFAEHAGWSPIFVGVILLAIIGNAAEHSTAILMAKRNDMETAMTISYQSSLQIALFATPVLVLVSAGMAGMGMGQSQFMDMMFSPMEIVAVILSVILVTLLAMNGSSNWFEGAMLLALYAILGIAFFYIPR